MIELHIPALRERRTDITILAHHFLRRFAESNAKEIRGFSDEALGLLARHSWPGNVRELENAIERAVVLSNEALLDPSHFPTLVARSPEGAAGRAGGVRIPGSTLADIEREAIQRTLESVSGSTSRAAQVLGISPRKIQYKLKEYEERARTPVKGRSTPADD